MDVDAVDNTGIRDGGFKKLEPVRGPGQATPDDKTIILHLAAQDAEAMRALLVRTVKDLEWEARDTDWHPQTRAAIGADAARFRDILDRLQRGMDFGPRAQPDRPVDPGR